MKRYEITLLIHHDASGQDIQKITDHYKDLITSFGGKLHNHEYWGLLSTAHKIKHNKKAHYLHLLIESSPSLIQKVRVDYNYHESVLLGFIIRSDVVRTTPSHMMAISKQNK